ncbi:MAG: M18 family aminopeptidase, partial [Candidatus Cloacimonetes bacterium]|nr:M18 family aminopeptidase [Candidatus Cloacimonadota bacterium]
PCSLLAAHSAKQRLLSAGFTALCESQPYNLQKGGRYFVERNGSALIAFVIGSQELEKSGFKLSAAHLDSPALKIKPETIKLDKGIGRVGIEVYGGPIISTWLDRELGIAGRVIVQSGGLTQSRLINLHIPCAIIPNAAIHLNREINKTFEYNAQTHLQAILGAGIKDENALKTLIAKELDILPEAILDLELYFYDLAQATLAGIGEELLVSGRLDDLAMAHAILSSILGVEKPVSTSMAVLYDSEEIGSSTAQGAQGSFLADTLNRICSSLIIPEEQRYIALAKSFLISADMAHAFHPSYAEKYDPAYSPVMNQGPVIKLNANFRYATDSESAAEFIRICKLAQEPWQRFHTRSDLPCGSTIGPIVSSALGIKTVDIGNPMWAMHSIRETCGTRDHLALINILSTFFKQ